MCMYGWKPIPTSTAPFCLSPIKLVGAHLWMRMLDVHRSPRPAPVTYDCSVTKTGSGMHIWITDLGSWNRHAHKTGYRVVSYHLAECTNLVLKMRNSAHENVPGCCRQSSRSIKWASPQLTAHTRFVTTRVHKTATRWLAFDQHCLLSVPFVHLFGTRTYWIHLDLLPSKYA